MILLRNLALAVTLSGALASTVPLHQAQLTAQAPLNDQQHKRFTIREQSDNVCKAGSRQWTGHVDVGDEKKLFYWFFESRNHPLKDPVVVWLNGGPGGSSMYGLFAELGPCLAFAGKNDTIFNEKSWSNFANILFLDQPASVGFSTVNDTFSGGPGTLLEAAIDFNEFLSIFFTDAFPQYSHLPFHIAGESFGGHYVPSFVKYISDLQELSSSKAFKTPIESIILVDAVLDQITSGVTGQYDHFCGRDENGILKPGGFNETTCQAIEEATPACERLNQNCLVSYDHNVCRAAQTLCEDSIGKWFNSEVTPGGRDPYDDRKKCGSNPPICEDFAEGATMSYLNLPHVKTALGLEAVNYSSINFELNQAFDKSGDSYIPTTREVSHILDGTATRVLVLNGNNDVIVNTEGQVRVYDQLPWKKQALYRLNKFVDWYWPSDEGKLKGGQIKSAGKLSFVSVDDAGHASPGDAPDSIGFVVDCWLNGGVNSLCPVGSV